MKRIILLFPLIFSACQGKNLLPRAENTEVAVVNESQISAAKNIKSQLLISSKGIGKAKLGMTLGKLKKISPSNTQFELVPSFSPDKDAIAVTEDGIVQYYILYQIEEDLKPKEPIISDNLIITNLVTNNDDYQTTEGVRVGTSIKDAEDIYGNAILSYNVEGESAEYITFGNENPEHLRFKASYFKLISDGMGFSGIYPEYPGVSYTTDKYNDEAAIAEIEVSCVPDECLGRITN